METWRINFNCIKLISSVNDCLCQVWFHLVEQCVKEDYTVKKFMTINEHQVTLKSHLACYWPKPIKKQQFQITANFPLEIKQQFQITANLPLEILNLGTDCV